MKIGKEQIPRTRICTADAERIVVHGFDLCDELIGNCSFTEYFWLLCSGEFPTQQQRKITDAVLVAVAEHGFVPSVIASRMTLAASPESMHGAVAAGLLGCGSVILGSSEIAGIFLHDVLARAESMGGDLAAAAHAAVTECKAEKRPIPGYGHPLHAAGDPRSTRLIQIAREQLEATPHVDAAEAVEAAIPKVLGKSLCMNASVTLPAVVLDAGFPIRGLKGIPLLARTAGLIGHLMEEMERPVGFALSYQAAREAVYEGAIPAPGKKTSAT